MRSARRKTKDSTNTNEGEYKDSKVCFVEVSQREVCVDTLLMHEVVKKRENDE